MTDTKTYTFLHGLLGTNIDWKTELNKSIGGKGKIITPSIDYFQDPEKVRTYINQVISDVLAQNPNSSHILISNSVGCHFGLDYIDSFEQCFFISPTYEFDRGSISRTMESIRSEVKKLFFNQSILEENADVLERESKYISDRLQEIQSIKALKKLKSELSKSNFANSYQANKDKIHVILGENDSLIPIQRYLDRQKELGVSIDIIPNCSHVAPVEKPDELRKILNKYGA